MVALTVDKTTKAVTSRLYWLTFVIYKSPVAGLRSSTAAIPLMERVALSASHIRHDDVIALVMSAGCVAMTAASTIRTQATPSAQVGAARPSAISRPVERMGEA